MPEECANGAIGKRPYSFFTDCAGQQKCGIGSAASSDHDRSDLMSTPDFEARLVCDHFAVHRLAGHADWRRRYVLGRELGAGQTATVFEAFAAGSELEEVASAGACSSSKPAGGRRDAAGRRSVVPRPGRRVALKRFYAPGTSMFQHELKALTAIGVHPNILRLLESFEGGAEDDVLVLEHCDGGDLYELYAANNGCCMLEAFVIQLIRQVLLALQHLVRHGVEHRDVKPENLLLFNTPGARMQAPQLKLADFGWAVVVSPGTAPPVVPPDGVGSLWYAPPELSPPVEGAEHAAVAAAFLGNSDTWSVGIITYLLLVGHSPFNNALRIADPTAREREVMRLAAFGKVNTATRPWPTLSEEARHFISSLVQPVAARRLSAVAACAHPWIARWEASYMDSMGIQVVRNPSLEADISERWQNLDGFQRLAWLACARAAAEPELMGIASLQGFVSYHGPQSSSYVEELAMELASVAGPSWFLPESAWADVQVLAFHYLDADADGLLSVKDLVQHMVGEDARESADAWVFRWRLGRHNEAADEVRGLGLADFRAALCASESSGAVVSVPAIGPGVEPPAGVQQVHSTARPGGPRDPALERRMQAIDEVCQRFLEEDFDDSGFGL